MPYGHHIATCLHCGKRWTVGDCIPSICSKCHSDGHRGTSLDCPPTESTFLSTLTAVIPELTSGESTITAADGFFCDGQTMPGALGNADTRQDLLHRWRMCEVGKERDSVMTRQAFQHLTGAGDQLTALDKGVEIRLDRCLDAGILRGNTIPQFLQGASHP